MDMGVGHRARFWSIRKGNCADGKNDRFGADLTNGVRRSRAADRYAHAVQQ